MTGATIGGGTLEWMTTNSSTMTALAVCITAITSIVLGIWNARTNAERNHINRREILSDIMHDMRKAGKSDDYVNDLIQTMRD
jgi:hypothetical protein